MTKRIIAIPGETLFEGEEYIPGEGTEKRKEKIIALRYGLVENNKNLIRVIPVSGVYIPRSGNVVIGKVENVTMNGWVIDITTPEGAFLSLMEVPRYVNKDDLRGVLDIGDIVAVKIYSVNSRGIDLTTKLKGLGKLDKGIIMQINPNKVPRVIGKEGSMISLIKEETKCKIIVGQNGLIWINGDKIEDELYAKKAILYVTENAAMSGLTDEMKEWFDKNKGEIN
ncbi:RNA-binding protein [Candidatus Woesearchaeota archaeon]|nr:RNA-binding protein [Candidatus Woesearchaeota archaeon]